jgi:hypothetical protein
MAVKQAVTEISNEKYATVTWGGDTPVVAADTFKAAQLGKISDKTVQFIGTIGGATYGMEGSMDGTNFTPLTTNGEDVIALTAAGMVWIWENPKFIRPTHTGGGGTESMKVIMGGSALV